MHTTVKCNNKDCIYNSHGNYCALLNIVIDKGGNCLYATEEKQETEVQKEN